MPIRRRDARLGILTRPGVAFALIALALLSTAGAIGLLESTETRYAEIAREMRATGDWLSPRLDGIPHFHKPPLAYWTIGAGFALLGENAWGARVPMTLAALGMLALTLVAARRHFAALDLPPGLVVWTLGASLFFLVIGRSVASDPLLALSVAAFWALAPSVWAIVALGVGFLDKGPVVFVPTVLVVLIAAAWARDRSTLARLGPAAGWIGFAVVALPWYTLMVARTPGLLRYFLVEQLWQRYTTQVHHRPGSPGYFVAVLLVGMVPWTPAMIAGVRRLWTLRATAEARLLLVWLFAPLVFFSFSGSKLPAYLLPCLPCAALIAATGLAARGRVVAWSGAVLLTLVAILGFVLGPGALARAVGANGGTGLPFPALFALACLLYASTWLARARPEPAGLLVVLAFLAVNVTLRSYEGPIGSPRPLVRLLSEMRGPREPVVEFSHFNAGVPFYLRETVRLLEVPRETTFQEPGHGNDPRITRDSLAALAAPGRRVWIVGPPNESARLAADLGLRYEKVTRWRKDALGYVTR